MYKIAFAAGGTLGHVYPSYPIIELLKNKDNSKILYFCDSKQYKYIKNNKFVDQIYLLNVEGFKRKLTLKNIKVAFAYIKSYYRCRRILKREKVDLVIGFGGYTSLPVVNAAIKLKIKTAIHEQNSVYGLANSLLKNKVDLVLNSYEIDDKSKLVFNPRISEYYYKYYHLLPKINDTENTVLVLGGSLGAEKINELIISLKDEFISRKIKVKLVTGRKYYNNNIDIINKSNCEYLTIYPFLENVYEHLAEAKVVVSRSGATTISEILGLRKVSLLIPSPNVTNNHQYKNAKGLVEKKMALLLEENQMSKDSFLNKINILLNDTDLRKNIEKNIKNNINVNASYLFYNEIKKILGEKC